MKHACVKITFTVNGLINTLLCTDDVLQKAVCRRQLYLSTNKNRIFNHVLLDISREHQILMGYIMQLL